MGQHFHQILKSRTAFGVGHMDSQWQAMLESSIHGVVDQRIDSMLVVMSNFMAQMENKELSEKQQAWIGGLIDSKLEAKLSKFRSEHSSEVNSRIDSSFSNSLKMLIEQNSQKTDTEQDKRILALEQKCSGYDLTINLNSSKFDSFTNVNKDLELKIA